MISASLTDQPKLGCMIPRVAVVGMVRPLPPHPLGEDIRRGYSGDDELWQIFEAMNVELERRLSHAVSFSSFS